MRKLLPVMIVMSMVFGLTVSWADTDKKDAGEQENKDEINAMAKDALAGVGSDRELSPARRQVGHFTV